MSLIMYALYDHPPEYSNEYVVRKFTIIGCEVVPDAEIFFKHESLSKIKKVMDLKGMVFISRQDNDDKVIMGVYI